MPWLAMAAVALCSALVLTTWSIMGGFLVMLLDIGRKMEGDVTITWPTVGFAYYEDLIKCLEADPMVEAAAPVIQTFGMINLPDNRVLGVQIRGIDERYSKVTAYAEALWWKPLEKPLEKDTLGRDPRLDRDWNSKIAQAVNTDRSITPNREVQFRDWPTLYRDGLRLQVDDAGVTGGDAEPLPAVVLGIELSGFSKRNELGEGWYEPAYSAGARTETGRLAYKAGFITTHQVTVNVLPLDRKGRSISVASRRLPVANEFRTGFFEADKNLVMMNLEKLQEMLRLNEAERVVEPAGDPYAITGAGKNEQMPRARVIGIDPARVTSVFVKARPGISSEQLRDRCDQVWIDFAKAHPGEVPTIERINISTWERAQATFVGAVKKETSIVLGMLLFISFVCVFLILAIFWSMVSEKTKDIGVLRSVGCGRAGVAWLWLRYGLCIGVVGVTLGGTLAYAIVTNINPIHEWLGRTFQLTLWDPRVYYFPEIPHVVEPGKAAIVLVGGVLFSVLGALIPAIKAARMDPVRALRFE